MFSEMQLRQPGFSWQSMLSLALASKYSYEGRAALEQIVGNGWEVSVSAFADIADTQVYALESDDVLVVVYRGTESIGDWLINVSVTSAPGAFGNAHRGFLNASNSVAQIISPVLEAASASGKTIWLTGHSLGGAIAVMTAAETFGKINLGGLVTFGQPRCLRRNASMKMEQLLGTRYFRFVNHRDVVPRVPTLFRHTGQLQHFDGYGRLHEQMAEAAFDEFSTSEPPPLTEEELAQLQSELKEVRSAIRSSAAEGFLDEGLFDNTIGALIPSISDHSMDKYISAVRRYATPAIEAGLHESQSIEAVLTPSLQFNDILLDSEGDFAMEATTNEAREPIVETGDTTLPLLIEVSDPMWVPPAGVKICSRYRQFVTVLAEPDHLSELASQGVFVEQSRAAGIYDLETSVPFVHGDAVHAPGIDERGDNCIVGVIDSGIDVLHSAFMTADGNKSRILGYWDQRDRRGPSPHKIAPEVWSQDYGTLHTSEDISNIVAAYQDEGKKPSFRMRDPGKHGTHVAGIAAGRSTGGLAAGMAPDAPIIVVGAHTSPEEGAPHSIGYSNSHVDALAFLRAASKGNNKIIAGGPMPISINISQGMNAGAHDGTTLLERAFDAATNIGTDPGVVIVKSAGNERNHAGHAQVNAPLGGTMDVSWVSEDEQRAEDYFEAWFGPHDDLAFLLHAPDGEKLADWVSFENNSASKQLGGNLCQLSLLRGHRDNGENRLIIRIAPHSKPIQKGEWKLEVHGRKISAEKKGELHVWVERNQSRSVRFTTHVPNMTLSVPGTAQTVVTVGACNTKAPWSLNGSSSFGPTRNDQKKPDICAPGFQIRSAKAGSNDHSEAIAATGTSMAAPHVAGAIALAFSRLAKMPGARIPNAVQVRAVLQRTVPGGIGAHHPGAGFGVLDAKAFYDAIIEQYS